MGAVVNQAGSWANAEWAITRAIGFTPRRVASDSAIITTAAAPSDIDDEVAAVTVPSFLNAGRNVVILSILTLPGVSSSDTVTSPRRELIVTGAISSANEPSATARFARVADSVAKASISSREKPYLSAVTWAKCPI